VANATNVSEIQPYLDRFPNGAFADLAHARIASLQAKTASLASPQVTSRTAQPASHLFDGSYRQVAMRASRCNAVPDGKRSLTVVDDRFHHRGTVKEKLYDTDVTIGDNGRFHFRIGTADVFGQFDGAKATLTWSNQGCVIITDFAK
jgi:hypothetical protein